MMCHCGKPLHYSDPRIQRQVENVIEIVGEKIRVTARGRTYLVPRHYLALHGLKEVDLPNLGFEEV